MFTVKSLSKVLVPALALGALVIGGTANAQILGTFGFVPTSGVTANAADVSTATAVTLASNSFLINNIPTTYDGVNPNDFFTGGAFPITTTIPNVLLSTTTLTSGGSVGLTFTAGPSNTLFTFTPTSPIVFVGTVGLAGNFLSFSEFGNLTDGPGFTPQAALFAGNFNQTAVGSAVNGSFTFSSPPILPPSGVPEPGTVAMLAGMATTGLGLLARRRRK